MATFFEWRASIVGDTYQIQVISELREHVEKEIRESKVPTARLPETPKTIQQDANRPSRVKGSSRKKRTESYVQNEDNAGSKLALPYGSPPVLPRSFLLLRFQLHFCVCMSSL